MKDAGFLHLFPDVPYISYVFMTLSYSGKASPPGFLLSQV